MSTSSIPLAIEPISDDIQQRIRQEVARYIEQARSLYQHPFPAIDVRFNLKGKAAGMYKVSYSQSSRVLFSWRTLNDVERVIRFNPWLFAKYPDDSWGNTIPHEVAHYIVDCIHGLRNTRPHGVEWRQVMADFGAEPLVRAAYDLKGIPVRQTRRYTYQCGCRDVLLTAYRHRKIQQGVQIYRCRDCNGELMLMPSVTNPCLAE
jgi:SprT protein